MRVEGGVVVGSNGKYQTRNLIARWLLRGFDSAVAGCVAAGQPATVLEIGCGEAHVTEIILNAGAISVLATDISVSLIEENAARLLDPRVTFRTADLFSMKIEHKYDLVVCCEVLEHLEDPEGALDILYDLDARDYVLSVPREPLWRFMNMCRGAYISDFGNSPGHIKHFSQRSFLKLVGRKFVVHELRAPLPWTVVRCRRR